MSRSPQTPAMTSALQIKEEVMICTCSPVPARRMTQPANHASLSV